MTSILLSLIIGPTLALGIVQLLSRLGLGDNAWALNQSRMWKITGGIAAFLLLTSPAIGASLAVATIVSLGALALKADKSLRNEIAARIKPSIASSKAWLKSLRFTKKTKSTTTASSNGSATPAPAPARKRKSSDEELLHGLLGKLEELETWTLRSDADRAKLSGLTSDTSKAQAALKAAVASLKEGTVNWNDIHSHVEGLKKHSLPADLSGGLDRLVAERAEEVASTRAAVGTLSTDLDGKRSELKAALEVKAESPEVVLANAEDALADAAELTGAADDKK